ncbi:hypothetical protein L2E82_28545 [Cichorium intybus]|uniref:Uncharacterized protein n=1 Tax=Cichorium intybus TaxID=13427 RepID=A0ACB9CW86_CICIN|nr:hypothetical protein L2E82_28545 [Cichorium intybus]
MGVGVGVGVGVDMSMSMGMGMSMGIGRGRGVSVGVVGKQCLVGWRVSVYVSEKDRPRPQFKSLRLRQPPAPPHSIPATSSPFNSSDLRFRTYFITRFAAAAEISYEEDTFSSPSSSLSSDGLEISSLGISQEIVTALAKKGITKLFPIQVT